MDDGAYYEHERLEMLPFLPTSCDRVLEVGCASGQFARAVRRQRQITEYWGVEPAPAAAVKAQAVLDRCLTEQFSDRLELPRRYFDCVLFLDSLEHMVDPFAALTFCRHLLRQSGVIVASIPNIRYFDTLWSIVIQKEWRYEEAGVLDRTHLRFFTEKSIRRTFAELGYEINALEGLHPLNSRRFRWVNRALCNWLADTQFPQYAVVAALA